MLTQHVADELRDDFVITGIPRVPHCGVHVVQHGQLTLDAVIKDSGNLIIPNIVRISIPRPSKYSTV